jgi:transposase
MFDYDAENSWLVGPHGSLSVPAGDQASLKMAMLLQGECTEVGPTQAAKNFKYSKSRYYQVREAFAQHGAEALINKKTGPKRNYRRTPEVTKLVIRARFLDPDASPEVIASKLRQHGYPIATRSVERIISDYGLQKKTPHSVPRRRATAD